MNADIESYSARLWDPTLENWEDIESHVLRLEHEAFADKAFEEEYLRSEMTAPDHVVSILTRVGGDSVHGFTYAVPVMEVEPHRGRIAANTAYIADSIVEASLRGRALVGVMMSCLEDELRRRGFEYVERHAAVAHGYSTNISRHYATRIEAQRRATNSEWGPQVFFRIRL